MENQRTSKQSKGKTRRPSKESVRKAGQTKERRIQQSTQNKKGPTARTIQKRNVVTMACITLVVCVILLALMWEGNSLKEKIAASNLKQADLNEQIKAEEDRTKEINNLEEYMQSDEYIEKAAREKAGLVKENEIIFKEAD